MARESDVEQLLERVQLKFCPRRIRARDKYGVASECTGETTKHLYLPVGIKPGNNGRLNGHDEEEGRRDSNGNCYGCREPELRHEWRQ